MILHLTANGATRLDNAHDFKRLHCAIDLPAQSLALAHSQLAPAARLDDADTAWIDVAWLRRQAPEADAPAWLAQLDQMLAKARPYGWVSDDGQHVKAHVVWAATSPSPLPISA